MRRALATALLTGYAVVLVLAAWPPEVRPHAIDLPSDVARIALRAVGIIPGLAVFETGYQDKVLIRSDCIRVLARDAQRRTTVLAPPDDHCVTEGVRLVVPWTEGALRALILRSPPGVAEAAIGDWVCHGPHWRASPSQGWQDVTVVWTQPYLDLRSREEGVANAAAFVWRCDPPGLMERLIRPTDAELRALEAGAGS
jgi:hypothetical protein